MKALIAIDGSPESALALDTAADIRWPVGSRLEIVNVLPTDVDLYGGPWAGVAYVPSTDGIRERLEEAGRRVLGEAAARLRRPSLEIVVRQPQGRPASVIVDRADQMSADLIILGARGHGALEGALMGSVSSEVVDRAHCAVLVARRPTTRRILVATDGSVDAMAAVDFVGRSGLFEPTETRVIHAIDLHPAWWLGVTPDQASAASSGYALAVEEGRRRGLTVTTAARAELERAGLRVTACVRQGPAATAIRDEAQSWHADLVVVGTRGHGLVRRLLLGSTARSVLHRCPASVLITRGTPVPVAFAVAFAAPANADPVPA